jgi:predicted P-loop ATPase/GTPase|tara:strand:- start:178 stop:468 length:291 start_codon:yes stop_codon:yes gene_type:complete
MFKANFKKHIKRGLIAGYSNYERFRMFAGAAEVVYLNPSIKRLEQIKTYSNNLMKSDYTDRDVKRKARVLRSECESQQMLKDVLARFSRLRTEGVL